MKVYILLVIVFFLVMFDLFGFGIVKRYNRYYFDDLVGMSFSEFMEKDYKPNEGRIKGLYYSNVSTGGKRYSFDIDNAYCGYNRLDIITDNKGYIVKTVAYHYGELIMMEEKDEWMRLVKDISEPKPMKVEEPNWLERQFGWAYDNVVPNSKYLPSSKQVLTGCGVVLTGVAVTGLVLVCCL